MSIAQILEKFYKNRIEIIKSEKNNYLTLG